jgi:hypothetical protein
MRIEFSRSKKYIIKHYTLSIHNSAPILKKIDVTSFGNLKFYALNKFGETRCSNNITTRCDLFKKFIYLTFNNC